MTHVDLFSGIGGFALAARWAGFETIAFCDIEPYCQKVLRKHWPDVPIHDDVRTFPVDAYRGCTVLTGGFPCQPFSIASKTRRGVDDDRYLWPAMFDVIKEVRPHWVIAENVANIDGMALDRCFSDLESEGYETADPLEIPACAVDAWHKRERVWICAHLNGVGVFTGGLPPVSPQGVHGHQNGDGAVEEQAGKHVLCGVGSNTCGDHLQRHAEEQVPRQSDLPWGPHDGGLPLLRERSLLFEPKICRSIHGIPGGVDRLRALGNSIVPAVAYPILKAIADIESGEGGS